MDIYTIGGGEIVYEVLKSVSMCLNGGGGTLRGMLTIGGIAAAFMAYFMVLYGNIEQILRTWALPLMLMLHLLFLPTATVWIKDTITKYHYKIDKVPYGLAIFASNVSRIGLSITEMVEQNFSTPDDLRYQKSGMMFGSDILEKSKTFKIVNPNFRENMRNFVGQCVKYDIMLNGKYSFEQLRNSSDLWGLVTSNPSQNRGIFWVPLDGKGKATYVTCAGAVQKFNQAWAVELNKSFSILGREFFSGRFIGRSGAGRDKFVMDSATETALKSEIIGNLQSTAAYLGDLSQSAEEVLKQSILINSLEDSASENSKAAGNLLSYSESKALLQQNYSFETVGRLAAKLLPIMKAVIEALAYACFIFIIPLCMIPSGYKFLVNWIAILVWLQAWPPMYAILNFIMNIAARASTLSEIGTAGGLTIANYAGVSDANAEMKILAGYLAMSIPFICIAVVKGVGTFVHLAGQMTGTSMQAASSGAAEIAGGNFSYGNVSMSNTQLGNYSQLQRNFSSFLGAADHTLMQGREQVRYGADGSHLFTQQVSSGSVNGTFDSGESIAQSIMLQGVRSELRGTETSLAQANSIRDSSAMDLSRQVSQSINDNTTDTMGLSGSQVQTFQKALRVVTGHGNTDDYSQGSHTNASLSLGANVGGRSGASANNGQENPESSPQNTNKESDGIMAKAGKLISFGGGINGHTSADAKNYHSSNESHQSQDDMSYSEASGIVKSYANSIAHSSANSEVKSSASKYLQSVEQSETLGARKSALEQELHSMTESFSKNRSIGISTKMSLHDDAREELVQSMGISHEEANRMINRNTPEAQSAFERVYDQKQHSIQNKPMIIQSDWSIKSSSSDLRKQYSSSEKAMNENMAESRSNMKFEDNSSVKQKVANETQALNKRIDTGQKKIEMKKGEIEQKVNERAKDGTVVRVGKQFWNNATKLNPLSDEKE